MKDKKVKSCKRDRHRSQVDKNLNKEGIKDRKKKEKVNRNIIQRIIMMMINKKCSNKL